MLNLFVPKKFERSIYEIDPQELVDRNIKGIITDLDNTLVEWDRPFATPELINWFQSVQMAGLKVVIVSNNNKKRVEQFSVPLQIPYIFSAKKPLAVSFNRAAIMMDLKKEQVVVIGDQLLTDILGGNRRGFQTILVKPVASSDGLVTRFNRLAERAVFNWMKRKGMLTWEESKSE